MLALNKYTVNASNNIMIIRIIIIIIIIVYTVPCKPGKPKNKTRARFTPLPHIAHEKQKVRG